MGGAVYVGAFTLISAEVEAPLREFALAAASVADSLGIAVADGAPLIIPPPLPLLTAQSRLRLQTTLRLQVSAALEGILLVFCVSFYQIASWSNLSFRG